MFYQLLHWKQPADIWQGKQSDRGVLIHCGFYEHIHSHNKFNIFFEAELRGTNPVEIRKYNSVNLKYGFSIIEIRAPRDIIKFEEDED